MFVESSVMKEVGDVRLFPLIFTTFDYFKVMKEMLIWQQTWVWMLFLLRDELLKLCSPRKHIEDEGFLIRFDCL